MKRVVKSLPTREIEVNSVDWNDICVMRKGAMLNILINACGQGFIWSDLSAIRLHYGEKHLSVRSAVSDALMYGCEVFVLDSLSELADWIKDNS